MNINPTRSPLSLQAAQALTSVQQLNRSEQISIAISILHSLDHPPIPQQLPPPPVAVKRKGEEDNPSSKRQTPPDLINTLPVEILQMVFIKLPPLDLARGTRVCKNWFHVIYDDAIQRAFFPAGAFGQKEWATYFGDVGEVPPLPPNIHQQLNSPCPFEPTKKVKDTHMLVLIPKSVNGRPMTLKTLKELVENPRKGVKSRCEISGSLAGPHIESIGKTPLTESTWVLMTRNIIPGSRDLTFLEQIALIPAGTDYQVPKFLEAAICIFVQNVSSQVHGFTRDPWRFTRCQEKILSHQMIIGGLGTYPDGLCFNNPPHGHGRGLALLRKL